MKILATILKNHNLNDQTGLSSTRKSVWIQEGHGDNRFNLYSKATPREMPRTNCGSPST